MQYKTMQYNTVQYNVRWSRPYNNTLLSAQYTAAAAKVSVNTFYDGAPYPSAGKRYF